VLGVNDRVQLAEVEAAFRAARAAELMLAGATLVDPLRIDIRGKVTVERDVFIDVNAVLIGRVHLAARVSVGPGCLIRDSRIGADTEIQANCVIEDAAVGEHARIGPFARLRPGAVLGPKVHIGNFVEVKNSSIGAGSKVNHLSYIGDARVGAGANVGAGTITCNYDGFNKSFTDIGAGAFIGSNSSLVAPVTIADGAIIGAGSVITKDVAENALAVGRGTQMELPGWAQRFRDKMRKS
jgi:bifunctional UDP-N-acetylglucosamine pyrophosphorylase/glucosamine-1-phosphate N-acetyltransferase